MNLSDILKKTQTKESIKEKYYFVPSDSYCRPFIKRYKIKIGPSCQTIQYNIAECQGFCKSQSMIWKNQNELKVVSCCQIKQVHQSRVRIYCLKRLNPNQINHDIYERTRDMELIEIFKQSFTESSWTDQITFKDNNFYTGYFSILMPVNISCQCQYHNF
ncbi:hypothetical protein BpHYR1_030938 [Brachionus plicatilis]|uniref:Uncharacterized protein n=1 Tax=Brachionus plicatilis TaxID=10195 RepID=A0A3M7SW48_BRAPC|nr:hypothetical protein BpHYR1_030938 [Brachionus plicatilis]